VSGAFDPVTGRPTGSAPASGGSRTLPSGTIRTQRRKRSRRSGPITGLGLLIGLALIGVALATRSTGAPQVEVAPTTSAPPSATTTTSTTTTTTTTTTTSTTVTSAQVRPVVDGWTVVPVRTTTGGPGQLVYDVPPTWQQSHGVVFGGDPDYALLQSSAEDPSATCAVHPSAGGVYFDRTQGPSTALATRYANGLATAAFTVDAGAPDVDPVTARSVSGPGWSGRLVVVQARLAKALPCGLTKGAVALVAFSTEQDPGRTIMLGAYAGQDSDDGTDGTDVMADLIKIVQSARVTP
jgi:hypothetical protein